MPVGGPISELTTALDRLVTIDVAQLGDAELSDGVRRLRLQRARLAAVEFGWSRAFVRRRARRREDTDPPTEPDG